VAFGLLIVKVRVVVPLSTTVGRSERLRDSRRHSEQSAAQCRYFDGSWRHQDKSPSALRAPSVVKANVQVPCATVAVQESTPSETVTLPVGGHPPGTLAATV
jgi:hypothetical protein